MGGLRCVCGSADSLAWVRHPLPAPHCSSPDHLAVTECLRTSVVSRACFPFIISSFQVMPCQHQRTEIRSLVHHSSAYAVLACPHEHSKPGSEAAPHSNWVTDLSHGVLMVVAFGSVFSCLLSISLECSCEVWRCAAYASYSEKKRLHTQPLFASLSLSAGIVSCLVFTLTTDSLQRYFQPPVSSNAPPPSTTTTGQVGRVSVQENGSPQQEQQQQQGSSKGVLAAELAQLWQALELHKPVLLLVQRDGQVNASVACAVFKKGVFRSYTSSA